MLEQFVGNVAALLTQMGRSTAEIDRIPVNNGLTTRFSPDAWNAWLS
jgi:hypothetical protein